MVDGLRLEERESDAPHLDDVLYVGTVGGLEADIVERAGIRFQAVQAGALRGLSPRRLVASVLALLRGCAQAFGILRAFRPDVVLATGGYASAPAVVAAWLLRCPVLIYLPDILPGLAVKVLSRFARRVAVSFEVSRSHFPAGKVVVTGYPVRRGLECGDAGAARERLGLAPDENTLLVMGGSRGAHSINEALADSLEVLLKAAQLIHVTGDLDIEWVQRRKRGLPEQVRKRYHPRGYLHEEMLDALQAADLAVARAGAATMGEFAACGLPSVLVPYPHAVNDQEANADFMEQQGAAVKLPDRELAAGGLGELVVELLDNGERRRGMSQAARALARPDAAQAIARQLVELAGGK